MQPPGSQRFDGKVALVTGAGRGAGRAVAVAFARQGARVAVNDITPINLDHTLEQIHAAGGQAQDYVADVSKQMPVESMIARVLGEWGRIDALVNAAGVRPRSTLFATDEWDWRHTIDVNLSAPFFTIQIAGRAMQAQGGGAIVNFVAPPDYTGQVNAAFLAGKIGLIGLTQEAARELAPDHIRVNAICPAINDRETGWRLAETGTNPQAEKIARLALYLCGDAAAHLTGQIFNVDDWEG